MLKQQMEYGAVSAKVMAMYGKMLKDDDWHRLCDCKSVTEICAILRNHKGWSKVMSEIPPTPTTKMLETAVRKSVYEDYEKLYKFLQVEDKKYLRFFLYRAEYDFILDALKEKSSSSLLPKTLSLTDYMKKNSSVDIDALEHSRNLTEILNAVKDSIYYKPLTELKLNPETGKPSYWEAGVVLENAYYKAIFSYLSRQYKGLGREKLKDTLGLEADLINITGIIRIQRSFHSSLERANELLIPITHHLKPELINALLEAKSEAEALDILRRSPLGKHLEGADTGKIESIFYNSMESFCRKLLRTAGADVSIPQAYLVLKELECKKLNRVIEAVSVGVDPKNVI
ncbi:MAG: V-type ATPase subunit [Oscillospiraceae bacterium]